VEGSTTAGLPSDDYNGLQGTEWYMALPVPTLEQSGFCSVVYGALTGSFAIWLGKEK